MQPIAPTMIPPELQQLLLMQQQQEQIDPKAVEKFLKAQKEKIQPTLPNHPTDINYRMFNLFGK